MSNRLFVNSKLMRIVPIAIIILIFLLIYFLPLPRQIGLTFRYDLGIIVLILFPVAAISLYPKDFMGDVLTAIVVALLFALPLSGLWASGQSETYILFGSLPRNDAQGYYQSALRFISGNYFIRNEFIERPISPAFLSFLLRMTGQNLQISILMQTALCAIVSLYVIRFIRKKWSFLPASIFLILLFLFYRQFIGTVLTENTGLFLGLLGFVLLICWSTNRQNIFLFLGILLLTLALNARAGAYFILLSLVLMAILNKKLIPKKALLVIILGIIFGFFINTIVSIIYIGKNVAVPNNFLYNLYQLVTNSEGWMSFSQKYPEISSTDSYKIIQIIIAEFVKDPTAIIKGVARSYSALFSFDRTGAFGFIEGARVHTTKWTVMVGSFGLFMLSITGLLRECMGLIKRKELTSILLLYSLAGILLSVPFIYPGDFSGMRFFAATISFQIIFPVLGLKYLLEKIKILRFINQEEAKEESEDKNIIGFSLVFTFILFSGLFINPFFRKSPQVNQITCKADEVPVAFTLEKGSFVNILADEDVQTEWLPDMQISQAKLSSHGLTSEFSSGFELLKAPFSIYSGLNYYSGTNIFLVMAPSEIRLSENYEICAIKPDLPALNATDFLFTQAAYRN